MKLLDFILGTHADPEQRRAEAYKAILHYCARVGGGLFGPIPKGTRREFFCLDEFTWVWHEEWEDAAGHHVVTTRYDVRPNGVYKSQGANSYQPLSPQEAKNFYDAVMSYYQRVAPELMRLQHIG